MKFVLSKKFTSSFTLLSESEKQEVIIIYDKIRLANSIFELDANPLVGMPYLRTIEFGKYVIGIQVMNNEIELAGIVEKGNEFSIFV